MQLNGVELTERFNRPSVAGKVALRAMFLNDGQYQDPYDISACTVFTKLANATPDTIVNSDGIIKSDQPISSVLMSFGVSGEAGTEHDGQPGRTTSENPLWVSSGLYGPEPYASGIYQTGTGQYVAVLDGSIALSGGYNMHSGFFEGTTVENGASSVQDYIDVWTVKMTATSEYQLFINEFRLDNDAWVSLTQPLLLSTSNRLVNKHVTLGSIVNLKVTTDLTVQNRDLDSSVRNIIESYGIDNAFFKIQKVNEGTTSLPSLETVFDYRNVDQITSDNTMIYSFNVDNWLTTAALQGGGVGTFALTASYTFLGETIKTKPLYFTIS